MCNTTNVIIFAGPSIFGLNKNQLDEFQIRPPAKMGDITHAVITGTTQIGLIDGVFESELAVWHKEILYALSLGCKISGASSLGALRAAECSDFGMIGIGQIFQEYMTGKRTADGDVALIHASKEMSYQPLSIALVDVEATLVNCKNHHLLKSLEFEKILVAANNLHFSQRTWRKIIGNISLFQDKCSYYVTMLEDNFVSQKQLDAIELLNSLKFKHLQDKEASTHKNINFQHTAFFEKLLQNVSSRDCKK